MAALQEVFPFHEHLPVVRKPAEVFTAFPSIARVEGLFAGQLESEIRYNRYRVSETKGEWVQILGPDVLFKTHPHATAEHTFSVITTNEAYGNNLPDSFRTRLYIAPFIHDWGELKVDPKLWIGDVSYDKKTREDEEVEMRVFDKVLLHAVPQPDWQLLASIYDEIVMDRNSPMGKIFNIAERVGYMSTAIRAYLGHQGRRIENWQGLVGNVFSNQVAKFVQLRRDVPFIDTFINENERIISAMLEETTSKPPCIDREETLSFDAQRLESAYAAWIRR